jgi:hypothetical protein
MRGDAQTLLLVCVGRRTRSVRTASAVSSTFLDSGFVPWRPTSTLLSSHQVIASGRAQCPSPRNKDASSANHVGPHLPRLGQKVEAAHASHVRVGENQAGLYFGDYLQCLHCRARESIINRAARKSRRNC